MKAVLLALLVLSSARTWAAEWLPFHAGPDGLADHFYDWDSLSQTADGFETDIKVFSGPDRRASSAHLQVDCRTDTWQLGKDCLGDDTATLRTAPIPIGDTTIAVLRNTFCVDWREPEGVHWRVLGTTHQGTTHYDERVEPTPTGFATHILLLGEQESYLAKLSIDCVENRYVVTKHVARDEQRGLLVSKNPAGPLPIEPDTIPGLLKASHCQVTKTDNAP